VTSSGGESAWHLMTGTVILGAPLAFAFALLVDQTSARGEWGHLGRLEAVLIRSLCNSS
jgi:hypothetical protein